MGQGTRPPKGTVPRTAIFAQGASARVIWGNEPRTDGGREKKWLDDKTAAESDSVSRYASTTGFLSVPTCYWYSNSAFTSLLAVTQ